jgi:hypothetical protein
MIILGGWLGLAVLNAVVFAALGRAGLDEDRERGYVSQRSLEPRSMLPELVPLP